MTQFHDTNWREIASEELRSLWNQWIVTEKRTIFNGCTDTWLREQYGAENIKHVMGDGWYRKALQ